MVSNYVCFGWVSRIRSEFSNTRPGISSLSSQLPHHHILWQIEWNKKPPGTIPFPLLCNSKFSLRSILWTKCIQHRQRDRLRNDSEWHHAPALLLRLHSLSPLCVLHAVLKKRLGKAIRFLSFIRIHSESKISCISLKHKPMPHIYVLRSRLRIAHIVEDSSRRVISNKTNWRGFNKTWHTTMPKLDWPKYVVALVPCAGTVGLFVSVICVVYVSRLRLNGSHIVPASNILRAHRSHTQHTLRSVSPFYLMALTLGRVWE